MPRTKWAKFTYVGRQTRTITKLFKNTSLKIAFTTDNTISKILTQKKDPNFNKFRISGVYQLTCHECNKKYIGQTGISFEKRFQEHLRDYKSRHGNSKFAQHLLDNKHSTGPMQDVMKILHINKKGKMMNTLENFYVYKETKANNQINDKGIFRHNIKFDTIIHRDTGRGQPIQ